jgi:acyl-CoA hydrolase
LDGTRPHTAVTGPNPPEDVLAHIGPGADVIVPIAMGEPPVLIETLEAHHQELSGVRVHQMLALVERPYIRGECGDHLRHVSYFLSAATRPSYWAGACDLVPNNFSEVPALLLSATKCSLVLARSSLPDRHGFFSLGTNADYVASLIGRVPFFLEADPAMPRTFGENQLHASQVLGWCQADRPLVEAERPSPGPLEHQIAGYVAERIRDGSTCQVGIGAIPDSILQALQDHRNLGIHTELVSDGIMELVDRGVVTGTRKQFHRNKIVATFCLGSNRLYEWLDENTAVELLPVDLVNDPRVIGQEANFVSINATTEVDLVGQCASETIGGRYWSSSGGQADFARGAMYSEGGQGFIVLRSTTSNGLSRIRSRLSEGSMVTTLKNTADHVVTEWGVAELRGRSIAERARSLIAIAHPQARDGLEQEAMRFGLLGRHHDAWDLRP